MWKTITKGANFFLVWEIYSLLLSNKLRGERLEGSQFLKTVEKKNEKESQFTSFLPKHCHNKKGIQGIDEVSQCGLHKERKKKMILRCP